MVRCKVLTVRPHTTVAYSTWKKYIRNRKIKQSGKVIVARTTKRWISLFKVTAIVQSNERNWLWTSWGRNRGKGWLRVSMAGQNGHRVELAAPPHHDGALCPVSLGCSVVAPCSKPHNRSHSFQWPNQALQQDGHLLPSRMYCSKNGGSRTEVQLPRPDSRERAVR